MQCNLPAAPIPTFPRKRGKEYFFSIPCLRGRVGEGALRGDTKLRAARRKSTCERTREVAWVDQCFDNNRELKRSRVSSSSSISSASSNAFSNRLACNSGSSG